jgi:uncharacterized OB-fold protein
MGLKRIPVTEGLFTDSADEPRLLGSRCTNCSIPYFPKSAVCHNPDCGNSTIEDASFGPTGKIWSCARQDYEPPAPVQYDKPFEPYAMAVVDLDDGLRVLGRIATDDPHSVAPDMNVKLVVEPLAHDEEANELVSWQRRIV